jgi:hypothetical protein
VYITSIRATVSRQDAKNAKGLLAFFASWRPSFFVPQVGFVSAFVIVRLICVQDFFFKTRPFAAWI